MVRVHVLRSPSSSDRSMALAIRAHRIDVVIRGVRLSVWYDTDQGAGGQVAEATNELGIEAWIDEPDFEVLDAGHVMLSPASIGGRPGRRVVVA